MTNTWEWGHDWRRGRYRGLHLIELAWERRPGEWFALHVALLGVWGTWTRYAPRKRTAREQLAADLEAACLDSPSNRGLSGWVNAPVESLGREKAP